MIIHRNEMKTETKEQMQGGEGAVGFVHFTEGGAMKNARLLAELTLPPGASIGDHQHDKETEYFIFVSGAGVVYDNGAEFPVKAGDVMVTGNGASHGLKNTGSVPLVLHTVIVTH